MILVCSRQGGFVTRNCVRCGKPSYVNERQLPALQCERCDGQLKVMRTPDKNYAYAYDVCNVHWLLPGLLPDWSDLFPYWGLAAPGDIMFPK
jgi:hypothetical protein